MHLDEGYFIVFNLSNQPRSFSKSLMRPNEACSFSAKRRHASPERQLDGCYSPKLDTYNTETTERTYTLIITVLEGDENAARQLRLILESSVPDFQGLAYSKLS